MGIQNFPTALQGIIQQGYLERAFQQGLRSRLGFRNIANKQQFPNRIGETLTATRAGLKVPVTTPMNPTNNTNFDNGMTPSGWSVEQFTMTINMYGDSIDLNTITQAVGISSQFVQNAIVNGIQSAQSLDRLARNALFYGLETGANGIGVGGYLGGNTRVRVTLGAPAATISVDDIRGFQYVFNAEGQVVAVSASNTMAVTVGSDVYTLEGATADGTNVSTAPNGVSGTLTFTTNVTVSDGTALNAVIASVAPLVLRPNGKTTTAALVGPTGQYGSGNYVPGDSLTIQQIVGAVAALRSNNVPPAEGGFYNCYLDDIQLAQLFRDGDFKLLYRGAYGSEAYKSGQIFELVGARFITTTEAPQQASLGAGAIHRALVCGDGALVEGTFEGQDQHDTGTAVGIRNVVDDVVMVTREPIDRLQQIIAQSWYWIGGYSLPTDLTANTSIIPTASNSYLKRAVLIESCGS
jgi:hypothetical protein